MVTKTASLSAWPILGAAIVACSLFAGSVAAKDVTVAIQVSTQGLDLSQPAGAHQFYRRLQQAARVACTHGVFCDGALERIAARPEVTEIVCTNTVPVPGDGKEPKLTVISLAPALAEAIRRIHEGESVSALFGPH